MKWRPMVWMLVSLCLLTGCASLLERTYSKVEPHSSRFWESEAADTLRAENYQDIVNDLLILIGQHTESASLRLYNFEDDLAAAAAMEHGAFAVVVGTAITHPTTITSWFASALPGALWKE